MAYSVNSLLTYICILLYSLPTESDNRPEMIPHDIPYQVKRWFRWSHDEAKTFREAAQECGKDNATLFIPKFTKELEIVDKMINDTGKEGETWVGIHSLYARLNYSTVEGIFVHQIFPKWASGQPDTDDAKRCIYMKNKELYTEDCKKVHQFICVKDHWKEDMNMSCDTLSPGYAPNNRNTYCFKVVDPKMRNWHVAYKTCHDNAGRLPHIKSETMAKEVMRYIKNHINSRGSIVHTGLSTVLFPTKRINNKRVYLYDNGKTPLQTGFNKWLSEGHPNATGPMCGAVHVTDRNIYRLEDVPSDEVDHFLCEMAFYDDTRYLFYLTDDSNNDDNRAFILRESSKVQYFKLDSL